MIDDEDLTSPIIDALDIAKNLLDEFIEDSDIFGGQWDSVEHFIKATKVDCECDDYYGFNCGCGERRQIREKALDALQKLKEEER